MNSNYRIIPALSSYFFYSHYISCKSKTENRVYSCGYNQYGQLGHGNEKHTPLFTPILMNYDIEPIKIFANYESSAIIDSKGNVYTYGRNKYGNLGYDSDSGMNVHEANKVEVYENNTPVAFRHLSISAYYMAALTHDNDLYLWGDVSSLELEKELNQIKEDEKDLYKKRFNQVDTLRSKVSGIPPTKVNLDFKVKSVAAGDKHIVLVSESGDVYVSGSNYNKQLGINSFEKSKSLTKLDISDAAKVVAGIHHTLVLTNDGKVYSFGKNTNGQSGHGKTEYIVQTPKMINTQYKVKDIIAGDNQSFLLDSNNNLYGIGYNKEGTIGLNTTIDISHPTKIDLLNIKKADSGSGHSILISDNNIYLTGRNEYGQLGNKGVRGDLQSVAHKRLQWYKYDHPTMDKCVVQDIASGSNHSMFLAQCSE